MTALFIAFTIIFLMALVAGPIVFLQSRKTFREQKSYERGLKIVPLLIHMPPPSDDTEVGTRDARDVNEETISKAEVIYDIIASTLKKDFKSSFYGQRHFAFEIVGSQGFIFFYAAVPLALLEVVKQAIVTAYPAARLEEVAEHNIFSPVGKVSGTLGGELSLKTDFAYPIATYQDIKRDSMQSLINSLANLGKEDGVGIQILMRPANDSWRKEASSLASKKRKGGSSGSPIALLKSMVTALVKPPEHSGKDGESKSKDLSNLESSTLDAIDEKTRHPGYETVIRIVVSSNISQRAEAILNNVVSSFALYDAPGKNGFKYVPAKDIDGLITSYIMRFFPVHHNKNILNSVELASLFHFPDQRSIPTSQLGRQDSKQVDGPRNMPNEGMLLGYNLFRGIKKAIRLGLGDRQRHMYVVGQTGTGKSTFLENLALQDMLNGNGFAFVDPHGDTAEKLLAMVPKERTEDVIYFSPSDMDFPMGLNLFEFNNPEQKDFLIQETLNMLYKLYDPQHQGIMGPRYEHLFRNAALTIMADPEGGTFVDIPKLFRDPQYVKQKLQHVTDPNVLEFWQKEMPASQRSNEFGDVVSWFVSKFGAFLSNEMMRNIIGQTKSAFDMRDIMDNKKILLVNLSKGRLGELNSKLLGIVFVMKFQAAAMSRSDIPEDQRVDFSLYVDEFQNFSTDSFATIMSEARKYHLNLIVANQFTTQLTQEIRDAVFGNMGTIVSFRIGQNDVESIGQYFQPTFDGDDLLRIPNYNTIVRTLIGGVPTNPFSMATLPALGTPNPRLYDALKQLSASKYGRPKYEVEQEINARMLTRPVAPSPRSVSAAPGAAGLPQAASPSAYSAPAAGPAPGAPVQTPRPKQSFLDEWLTKKQAAPAAPAPAPQPQPVAPPAPAPQPVAPPQSVAPQPVAPPAPQPIAPVQPQPQPVPAPQSQPLQVPGSAPEPKLEPSSRTITPDVQQTTTAPKTQPKPPESPEPLIKKHHSDVVMQDPSSVVTGMPESEPDVPAEKPPAPKISPVKSTTKPKPNPKAKTANISSSELSQQEVDKIAAELEDEIAEPAQKKPAGRKKSKTEDSIELKPGKDDTIFIDQEGSFHLNEPSQSAPSSTDKKED